MKRTTKPYKIGLLLIAYLGSSCSSPSPDTSEFPAPNAWTMAGVAVTAGPHGSWDTRLHGMISPIGVVKKSDTYYLYYIGADGDRSWDGGPRHRSLGVATSDDGLNFTKYAENPIITFLPNNNEEEGVFSGAITIDESGRFVLYYGAMNADSATSTFVNNDVRLAISADGFTFRDAGVAMSHDDASIWGYGDEITPIGVLQRDDLWHLFYIAANGTQPKWSLGYASGPGEDNFTRTEKVIVGDVIGGGDIVNIEDGVKSLFLLRGFSNKRIEAYTFSPHTPTKIGDPQVTYRPATTDYFVILRFATADHFTILRDNDRWLMYQLDSDKNRIVIRQAPSE